MPHQPTAPLPATASTTPPRSGWFLRFLFGALFAALLAAASAVTVLVAYTLLTLTSGDRPAQANPPAPEPGLPLGTPPVAAGEVDVWDRHGPVHILLLGLDKNDCNGNEGRLDKDSPSRLQTRTDTIILVRVDPAREQVTMLSIPRDLYVYIDADHGAKKITTVHVIGTRIVDGKADPYGGPALVKRVLQNNLDLPVHRFVRADFQGFKDVVDALDGIEVDVPPSPHDPAVGLFDTNYPDGHCGTMTVQFPPGRQSLDGEQALRYARSRYSTSDFDRSRRQMQVLLAIREKGTRLGTLLDLPQLVPAIYNTIDTDLAPGEILSLARLARGIQPDDVTMLQIDDDVVLADSLFIDGVSQSILRLQPDAFATLRAQFLDPSLIPTPTPPPTATPEAQDEGSTGGSAPARAP